VPEQIVAENPVDLDHLIRVACGGVGVEHAGSWLIGAISPLEARLGLSERESLSVGANWRTGGWN